MRLRPRFSLLLCWLLLWPACPSCSSQENVLITSDPLGARVTVDGEDTGRSTPVRLTLGGTFGANHTVVLQKKGYRPAARRLYQYTEGYTSKWIDGAYAMTMPPLPLFWTTGDLLLPLAVRSALLPAEIHVRLEAEDAPLLGFDLLAARAAANAADQQP